MKKGFYSLLFAIVSLCSTHAFAAPIGLAGDTIDAAVLRLNSNSPDGFDRVCCYGLDGSFVVQDGTADQKKYSVAFILNVDNLGFDIDFLTENTWQEGFILRLSGLDFSADGPTPFSLGIESNLSGLTWNVGADYVDINLFSISQLPDSYLRGTFVVATVPEPATLLLMGLGLVGVAIRRQGLGRNRVA